MAVIGTVAVLAFGLETPAKAQAVVSKGETTLTAELPFVTMPDDPFVVVFVEELLNAVVVLDSSGGAHILVKEVKEILSATVVGTNFDYELVSHEAFSPNNITAKGHFAGSVQQSITLIRIDPATSLPVALVEGEGFGHLTVNSEGEVTVNVEKMEWTITSL